MAVRILMAEGDAEERDLIRETAKLTRDCEIVGYARDGREAIQMALQLNPDIVLLAHDLPGLKGPEACEILTTLKPEIMSVLLSDSKSHEQTEHALRAGARGLITRPVSVKQLNALISDLIAAKNRMSSQEIIDWQDPSRHPRVITVTGAKGGVGKSTLAVNLAVTLAADYPEKVVLLDLYPQFGDVATMFNVVPKGTIADMVPLVKDLDADIVSKYVTKHSSGVDILVSSTEPLQFGTVGVDCLDPLMHILKQNYRFILMDVPPILHEVTLHAMANSTLIFLVANLFDLTTATDTKKLYDALRNEHIPAEHIWIVLNRVSKANKLRPGDIGKMFDGSVRATIPNDRRLVVAINQGVPIVLTSGDTPLKRSFTHLADMITGTEHEHVEERSPALPHEKMREVPNGKH